MIEPRSLLGDQSLLAGIRSLEFLVAQDTSPGVVKRYSLNDLPPLEPCTQDRCRRGGLNLYAAACIASPGAQLFYCQGYVGGERSDPGARPCWNCFTVEAQIERVASSARRNA